LLLARLGIRPARNTARVQLWAGVLVGTEEGCYQERPGAVVACDGDGLARARSGCEPSTHTVKRLASPAVSCRAYHGTDRPQQRTDYGAQNPVQADPISSPRRMRPAAWAVRRSEHPSDRERACRGPGSGGGRCEGGSRSPYHAGARRTPERRAGKETTRLRAATAAHPRRRESETTEQNHTSRASRLRGRVRQEACYTVSTRRCVVRPGGRVASECVRWRGRIIRLAMLRVLWACSTARDSCIA
jgi:hypothetical protein